MGGFGRNPQMGKRPVILCTLVVFCFSAVFLRLGELMLVDHERLSGEASSQYTGEGDVRTYRGAIVDRNGRELAIHLDVYSAYLNPREVRDPTDVLKRLRQVVEGIDEAKVLGDIKARPNTAFVWLKRRLTEREEQRVRSLGLKGVYCKLDSMRVYPRGRLGAHVVGFLDVYNKPLGGVELSYNDRLLADGGRVKYARDAAGRVISDGLEFQRSGHTLVLTLDEALQFIVEKEMDQMAMKHAPRAATVVMMDPRTGAILAMANRPTMDPNAPWGYSLDARSNRAVTDTFEPGSTFKTVTVAALLEEGLAEPNTRFDCSQGFIAVGRQVVRDVHRSGVLTLGEVLEHSSNVGTILASERLGAGLMHEYIGRFGFGRKTGLDLSGESKGIVRELERWAPSDYKSASIGYGIGVTAVQLARAYAVIANGGYLVTPHVVKEIVDEDGQRVYEAQTVAGSVGGPERLLSDSTVDAVRRMLEGVTGEGGTGGSAAVKGIRVAGKTGTVRVFDKGKGEYSTDQYVSLFAGFAPAENPEFVMVVVVYEPREAYYGGAVAAPVFGHIATEGLSYLGVPLQDERTPATIEIPVSGGVG